MFCFNSLLGRCTVYNLFHNHAWGTKSKANLKSIKVANSETGVFSMYLLTNEANMKQWSFLKPTCSFPIIFCFFYSLQQFLLHEIWFTPRYFCLLVTSLRPFWYLLSQESLDVGKCWYSMSSTNFSNDGSIIFQATCESVASCFICGALYTDITSCECLSKHRLSPIQIFRKMRQQKSRRAVRW